MVEALKWPIPKTTRKARSGVRISSPATNGIAAFAVTASCIRRWYANTLRMSTTRPCHRACMSTSRAQFGSESNSHRQLGAASRSDEDFSGCFEIQNDSGLPQGLAGRPAADWRGRGDGAGNKWRYEQSARLTELPSAGVCHGAADWVSDFSKRKGF